MYEINERKAQKQANAIDRIVDYRFCVLLFAMLYITFHLFLILDFSYSFAFQNLRQNYPTGLKLVVFAYKYKRIIHISKHLLLNFNIINALPLRSGEILPWRKLYCAIMLRNISCEVGLLKYISDAVPFGRGLARWNLR